MKKKKINIYAVAVLSLVLLEGIFLYLTYRSFNNKDTSMDEVKLLDSETIDKNNMFAIMLGDKDGIYTESESNKWPTDGSYSYNADRSGCIDANGNTLEGVLSFNAASWTATLTTNTTAYCYLYFDIDQTVPQAFTFYVGGNSNPTYSTSTTSSAYLSWTDTDIVSYCVTNTSGSSDCTWNTASGTSATTSHTLASTDGTKTVYAYIKDAAGNISSAVTDTIILDTTKPVVNSVTKTSDETDSITIQVSASDATSKVKTYYYQIGSNSVVSNTTGTYTFSGLTKGTSYTIKVYVVDNAELKSDTKTYTFATKDTSPAYEEILNNPTTGLNTTMEGGLYRYQGTTANNYICFGTSDKSTCTGNTDAYMYRIIGINENGQLKLIKKEALESEHAWHSSYTTNTTWPNSDLYGKLNGSTFLSNTTYVPSGWSDKIATTSWKYGDNTTYNTTAANLYSIENAWTDTVSAKIGLWYMHDYYYGMSGGNNCSSSGAYTTCKTSWIYLWQSGNDTSAPNTSYEWTMSRYGGSSSCIAWSVFSDGNVRTYWLTGAYSVRPVFYLTSDVEFVGGTGTLSDPFLIS